MGFRERAEPVTFTYISPRGFEVDEIVTNKNSATGEVTVTVTNRQRKKKKNTVAVGQIVTRKGDVQSGYDLRLDRMAQLVVAPLQDRVRAAVETPEGETPEVETSDDE